MSRFELLPVSVRSSNFILLAALAALVSPRGALALEGPRDIAFRKVLATAEQTLKDNPQSYLISVPTFAGIAANTEGETHDKAMAHLKDALSRGAPVNYRDGFGSTALHIVVDGSKVIPVRETLQLLLKYGADANQWNGAMQSPLQYYRLVHPEADAGSEAWYKLYDAWMVKMLTTAMKDKPEALELKRLAQMAADSTAQAQAPLPVGMGVAQGAVKPPSPAAPAATTQPVPLHAGNGG